MNNYTKAAVYARLLAASLPAVQDGDRYPHLADHAARAARLADFAMAECLKRFGQDKPKGAA
jgi:hypothetical protein